MTIKKLCPPILVAILITLLSYQEDTFEKIKLSHNFKSGSNSSGEVFFTEKDGGINFEAHILG